MPQVPIGDVTGYYYIVMANLPFNTPREKLYKFVANVQPDGTSVAVVDVCILEGSGTDAYACVEGKDSFLKAKAHLSSTPFEDRILICIFDNETKPLYIRTPLQNPLSSHIRTPPDWTPTMEPLSPSRSSLYDHTGPQFTVQYSPLVVGQVHHQVSFVQNVFIAGIPQTSYTTQPAPYSSSPYVPTPYRQTYSPPIQQSSWDSSPGPYVHTEARKIIIKNIPSGHSAEDVAKLVKWACKDDPDGLIETLEYKRYSDSRPRNAMIVLRSCEDASRAVRKLNSYKWNGTKLFCGLTKEGVGKETSTLTEDFGNMSIASASSSAGSSSTVNSMGARSRSSRPREVKETHRRAIVVDGTSSSHRHKPSPRSSSSTRGARH